MPKGRADGVSIRVSPFLRTKATVFLLSLFCAIHKCGRSLYVRIFYFSKAWKYGTASFHRAFARFHKGDTRRQLNSHIGKEYRVRGNARGNERVKARKTRSTSRRAGAQEPVPGMWREVFKNNVDGARWKASVLWNRARADPTSHVLT